ncbi:hypothetical protein CONCODRAFT_72250 [Conidiobolus coronatus NRRL 28638]|uniref:Uncharacterized protein n=1 Tax=Conidiobolus coronatus (strain ATCC 28846 / CBS 209.66 / NRRL 28638) TaxID=796925 RepID=A0A137P055_CONC2|nr:hypothetical protein CONCODRAFT_72250 [Conidiobolus coronatus NRRL 28638]|eukprot:KXN68426.1 hypothetical protein CONCODRAFT_72250 [Conidiobolus coronatus NRRL 28638]
MFLTVSDQSLSSSGFKALLICSILVLTLVLIILTYKLLIKPRRKLKKLGCTDRATYRGTVATTPNNRKSLILSNLKHQSMQQKQEMGNIVYRGSVQGVIEEEKEPILKFNPDELVPVEVQHPSKRYTPFSYDLSRVSVIDVRGRETNKY